MKLTAVTNGTRLRSARRPRVRAERVDLTILPKLNARAVRRLERTG
jgi:hypothetical protein